MLNLRSNSFICLAGFVSHPSGRGFSARQIASVVILALGQGKAEMPSWSPFQPYFSALFLLWFWESAAGTPLCWVLGRCGMKPAPPWGEEFYPKYKIGDESVWGSVATAVYELCRSHVLLCSWLWCQRCLFFFISASECHCVWRTLNKLSESLWGSPWVCDAPGIKIIHFRMSFLLFNLS